MSDDLNPVPDPHPLAGRAADLAASAQRKQPDPRLSALLSDYPPAVFSPRLYASIELADQLSLQLALSCAGDLGLWRQLATPRSSRALADERGFAASFAPALDWLLERLVAAGVLAVQSDADERCFWLAHVPPSAQVDAVRAAALIVDPANAASVEVLERAAQSYRPIAYGETSGRDALLGAGSVDLWLRYFSNDNPLYAVNNWIAATAACKRLAHLGTGAGPLRILEVGAGAGSGSARLLERLQHRSLLGRLQHYQVTEAGALLLRKCRRTLAAFGNIPLDFGQLDIDRPWDEHGVTAGSVDLIYAVNVLHVARDLAFTLRQARQSLAPGGWLVAGECLRPFPFAPLYIELVFRLLEDPDAVTDPECRPTPGFLAWSNWQIALKQAGFTRIECDPDHERIRNLYPKLFVAAVCAQK